MKRDSEFWKFFFFFFFFSLPSDFSRLLGRYGLASPWLAAFCNATSLKRGARTGAKAEERDNQARERYVEGLPASLRRVLDPSRRSSLSHFSLVVRSFEVVRAPLSVPERGRRNVRRGLAHERLDFRSMGLALSQPSPVSSSKETL